MKIAIAMAATWTGGIERVVVTLANRWADSGHVVRIVTLEHPGERPAFVLDDRVALEQLGLLQDSDSFYQAFQNNLGRVFALRRRLQHFTPDIVLAQGTVLSILTILAGIGQHWPTVATEQVHPAHDLLSRSWRSLRRIAYPFADALVVQTDDIAKWVETSWRLSAEVMPNPVDVARFSVALPPEQRDRRQLIAVGRLARQKGYDLLINAFARCARLNPAWDLVIYGDGPERAALETMIGSLGLSGRIILAGNTTTIEQAYAQADLLVHAARYEGYPNVIQEALAAGKPIIATDCPGATRQLLGDGKYGVLVPNEDVGALEVALRNLMTDDARRASLAHSARSAILTFEANHVAKRWVALFGKVIEQHRGRT